MKKLILVSCFGLFSIVCFAQVTGRVRSGNNLRWAMNGSVEVMEGDLIQHYGTSDSSTYKLKSTPTTTESSVNPHITRFSSVQSQCDNNSMILTWVANQRSGIDRYEIEQSANGVSNWNGVGSVLANTTQTGNSSYSYNYNKNAANLFFRIAAVTTSGERLFSSIFKSPCSVNSFLSIIPNPVYSGATLRIGANTPEKVRLMIVDTKGLVVQKRDVTLLQGANSLALDMSTLLPGYYILSIQRSNGSQDILNLIKQ